MPGIFIILCCACATPGRKLQCNLHVINLMAARGIYLPQADANGLDRYLRGSPQWQTLPKNDGHLDHNAAYKYAKKGKAVLLAYNTGTSASGHIVMVYGKKGMQYSNAWKTTVPYISGSLQGRAPAVALMSAHFNPAKEKRMSYYLYLK